MTRKAASEAVGVTKKRVFSSDASSSAQQGQKKRAVERIKCYRTSIAEETEKKRAIAHIRKQ